jgi:hypothetical protein
VCRNGGAVPADARAFVAPVFVWTAAHVDLACAAGSLFPGKKRNYSTGRVTIADGALISDREAGAAKRILSCASSIARPSFTGLALYGLKSVLPL